MPKDPTLPVFRKYQRKWVLLISLGWAIIDFLRLRVLAGGDRPDSYPFLDSTIEASLVRFVLVWIFSALLVHFVLMRFRSWFQSMSLFVANILKGLILCVGIALLQVLVYEIMYFLNEPLALHLSLRKLAFMVGRTNWVLDNVLFWILVIVPTQLLIEINEKYSPGVFAEIFFGRYIQPKEEDRIIMFIDLKDSTPIAEQLGHKKYFLFIRDFIHHVSTAMLEYNGRIYQYVGDEVVVSWKMGEKKGNKACIQALIAARKLLQKESAQFRQRYNITPEFRVGMHAGKVMVGEIGVLKKDLAMSGDAMNIAARIRSASSELNHRFIMSKDFVDRIDLEGFQAQSLGNVELKGKDGSLELYSLHI
ncbi:MAG: hypothetical protein EOO09_08295 [Chitinophagaceae bacterium]|nr:MAG: hypothetical protein EOO09_08295 [Chitinophagaceae bacterium]